MTLSATTTIGILNYTITANSILSRISTSHNLEGVMNLDFNNLNLNYPTDKFVLVCQGQEMGNLFSHPTFELSKDAKLSAIGYVGRIGGYHLLSDMTCPALDTTRGLQLIEWSSKSLETTIADHRSVSLLPTDYNMKLDSTETTVKHIERVASLCEEFANAILERGELHDASKLKEPEKTYLDQLEYQTVTYGKHPYGSPEYREHLKRISEFTKHHYAINSHHPEHYANGIAGMSLLDLVEMLCDWKAASERNEDACVGLTASVRRYGIDPQLASILENEIKRRGWNYV